MAAENHGARAGVGNGPRELVCSVCERPARDGRSMAMGTSEVPTCSECEPCGISREEWDAGKLEGPHAETLPAGPRRTTAAAFAKLYETKGCIDFVALEEAAQGDILSLPYRDADVDLFSFPDGSRLRVAYYAGELSVMEIPGKAVSCGR